jgi:hypothetical protein
MSGFTESVIEQAALAWLEALGYAASHGPAISAGEPGAERSDPNYRDVVLEPRLRQAPVITLERDPLAPCYEPYEASLRCGWTYSVNA